MIIYMCYQANFSMIMMRSATPKKTTKAKRIIFVSKFRFDIMSMNSVIMVS
jgi:hypothetical protein